MDPKLRHGFKLGDCVVHPLQGLIERPDGSDHVQPKVMEVLLCLAERPGEVVERDALVARAWGKTAVTDEVLTRCISELRHALGDQRDSPRFVQTIPKRGYRLVAPVVPKDSSDPVFPGQSAIPSGARRKAEPVTQARRSFWAELKRRNVVRVLIAYAAVAWLIIEVASVVFPIFDLPDWSLKLVVALAFLGFPVAAILSWAVQRTSEGFMLDVPVADRPAPVPVESRRQLDRVILMALLIAVGILSYREFFYDPSDRFGPQTYQNSVAVLRFMNMGEQPENTVFSDGIADEISNVLTRLGELKVPDRKWTWQLAAQGLDTPELAKRLGVGYLLRGSVRTDGEFIRVTAQLVDKQGFERWSGNFDRMLGSIFALEGEIARAVVEQLKVSLSLESEQQLQRTPTENPQAYVFYLQASDFLRRPSLEKNLESAEQLFARAVELDARFALAYAGLCETHLVKYRLHRATAEFEAAERACHRALTLDDQLSGVHIALGSLFRHSGQFDKAETEFRSAIERDPNLIVAHIGLAETLAAQKRFEEAEELFRRATVLQPGYWDTYNSFGRMLFSNGRFSEAIEQFQQVKELNPNFARAYNNLAAAYYMTGDFENAAQTWQESLQVEPTRGAYSNVGSMYFFLGRYEDSAAMYQKAVKLTPEDHLVWGHLANSYRFIDGRREDSIAAYERAIELAEAELLINDSNAEALGRLGVYYASTGSRQPARARIARALQIAPDNMYVQYDAALTHVRLGQTMRALDAIEQAVQLGYSKKLLSLDAGFASLKDEIQFQALLARKDG